MVDMNDPRSDGLFFITSDKNITKQVDKDVSWHVNHTSIRLNVDTPSGLQPWKNVEITGYVKIVSAVNNSNTDELEENEGNEIADIIDSVKMVFLSIDSNFFAHFFSNRIPFSY